MPPFSWTGLVAKRIALTSLLIEFPPVVVIATGSALVVALASVVIQVPVFSIALQITSVDAFASVVVADPIVSFWTLQIARVPALAISFVEMPVLAVRAL